MSGREYAEHAVSGRRNRGGGGGGGARADRLVLGAVAATVAGIVVRELIGPGSLPFPPGRMIPVDGRPQLVLEREGTRRPTIVFESGLGNPVMMWSWLFDHLPADTHLVAYDRPGIGWSRPIRGRLDSSRYPEHLLSLLRAAGAQPPYLLVGHSVGGLLIRLFAERHPELTAGLVFVDATHPAEYLASSLSDGFSPMPGHLDRWIVRAALGLPADEALTAELASLPPSLVALTGKARTRAGSLLGARRETGLIHEWATSCDQSASLTPRPVAVVSAGTGPARKPGFAGYQDDLAKLSEVSCSYSGQKATHDSLLTDREHSKKVAEAIVWALDRVPPAPEQNSSPVPQKQKQKQSGRPPV